MTSSYFACVSASIALAEGAVGISGSITSLSVSTATGASSSCSSTGLPVSLAGVLRRVRMVG